MPTITVKMAYLRPTTICALVADLMTAAQPDFLTIFALIEHLEILVGQEESVGFLIDAEVDLDCLYYATVK